VSIRVPCMTSDFISPLGEQPTKATVELLCFSPLWRRSNETEHKSRRSQSLLCFESRSGHGLESYCLVSVTALRCTNIPFKESYLTFTRQLTNSTEQSPS